MGDISHVIGSTGIAKKIVDLGDGTYADAVSSMPRALSTETVVAGAASTLGKIATLANAETIYVRQAVNPGEDIEWRVKSSAVHTVQKYKARTKVNGATLTLAAATRVDDTDTFTLNGLTYTAESTAGDAAYASRKWKSGGADESADAAALAALINADYSIVPDGSVAVNDTLVIVSDGTTYTYTGKATANYVARQFDQSGDQAAELASIVLALNHKDNVTCAAVAAGDKVYVNGLTFTAHTSTTTAANREFSIAGSNTQDGDELVTCLNDATYGVPGLTAVNAGGVVSFTRDTAPDTVALTSSNGTRLAVAAAGGIPGIIAAATGATGELAITPTWAIVTACTGGTHITATDVDCPGILAVAAAAVITLSCSTPGAPIGGDLASTIQFGQGSSAANEIAFADTTLASLVIDGTATTDAAANSTSAGTIYSQTMNGWEYGYLGVTNKSGGAAATIVVGATLH